MKVRGMVLPRTVSSTNLLSFLLMLTWHSYLPASLALTELKISLKINCEDKGWEVQAIIDLFEEMRGVSC